MQGVNVFENGIGYLLKCLNLYTSGTGYFAMYLIAVLIILIKGSKRDRQLFIPGAAVLLLTVYDPAVPLILDRIFDVSSEYYRLFWIAPVIVLVPYAAVIVIESAPTGRTKAASLALILLMFVLGGNFVYAKGLDVAENIYKIPDELIETAGIIHADSGTEYAKVFYEYEYNMEIRQYDPKILLTIDREEYLYAMNYSYTEEMLEDEDRPTNVILAVLVRNQKTGSDIFTDALEATGTQYLVLTKGHPMASFVKRAGLYEIGQTDTHVIYRYDLKEQNEYSLIDYTGVEHRFSYRRLK
ncbi:MAG: hypothetical protein IJL90_06780 [Lachnospiraceae bacterium]|nr:hypothetical protein [Lachnospiraceae bacterium]